MAHDTVAPAASATVPILSSTKLFALAFFGSAIAVMAIGWTTNLRDTANTALISVATIAFLPFLIIAAGLLLILLAISISIILAMLGGDFSDAACLGGDVAALGIQAAPPYYAWLLRIKHPIFWGSLAGCLLGGLILWGLIALIITPGEKQTAQILAQSLTYIETNYKEKGAYPAPDSEGNLRDSNQNVVLDGFGRPLKYVVKGKWKLASYTLSSNGYDGYPSEDDMKISGSTTLEAVAQKLRTLLSGKQSSSSSVEDVLKVIRAMKDKDAK
jgi:hypothetical protein